MIFIVCTNVECAQDVRTHHASVQGFDIFGIATATLASKIHKYYQIHFVIGARNAKCFLS